MVIWHLFRLPLRKTFCRFDEQTALTLCRGPDVDTITLPHYHGASNILSSSSLLRMYDGTWCTHGAATGTSGLWMNALPLSSRLTSAPRAAHREARAGHGVAVAVSPDLALLRSRLCYSCCFATVGRYEDFNFWQLGS